MSKKLINGLKYEKLTEDQLYDLSSWELVDIILAHRQQLDQLKKENDDLKNKIKELLHDCNSCNFHKYKQTLEEIKKIAEANIGRFPDGSIFARPEIEQILEKCEVIDERI